MDRKKQIKYRNKHQHFEKSCQYTRDNISVSNKRTQLAVVVAGWLVGWLVGMMTHLFLLEQLAFEQNVKHTRRLDAEALADEALGVTQPRVVEDADDVCAWGGRKREGGRGTERDEKEKEGR